MPGEGLTHGPPAEEKAGGSHHRISRIIRHSLRGSLRLIRALPGDRLDCPRPREAKLRRVSDNALSALRWAPAPGRQDHTISQSVITSSSAHDALRCSHVHRIADPTYRDDAYAPHPDRNGRSLQLILGFSEAIYFLCELLKRASALRSQAK